jgi:hypothetical protein
LAEKLVELRVFDAVSSSVQRALKNELKPWRVERFCIPPENNTAFVAAMEDVLEVYHRPYDLRAPSSLPRRLQQAIARPCTESPLSVLTIEDTQRFIAILPALAAAGIEDASAAPITDSAAAAGLT